MHFTFHKNRVFIFWRNDIEKILVPNEMLFHEIRTNFFIQIFFIENLINYTLDSRPYIMYLSRAHEYQLNATRIFCIYRL